MLKLQDTRYKKAAKPGRWASQPSASFGSIVWASSVLQWDKYSVFTWPHKVIIFLYWTCYTFTTYLLTSFKLSFSFFFWRAVTSSMVYWPWISYALQLQTVIWNSHEDVTEDTYTNLQLLLQRLFLNSARAAFHDSQFRNDPYLRHSLSVHHPPETSYSFQPPFASLYVLFFWFSHLTRIDLDSSQVWLLYFILIWLWGDHLYHLLSLTSHRAKGR